MRNARFIPVLLLREDSLIKTKAFGESRYIGDAINAVSIFSEKMVDELVLLDIDATRRNLGPRVEFIREIASEAFIPLCYGGGVTEVEQIEQLLKSGVEKVSINTAFATNPELVTAASRRFGSQSIVVSIDVALEGSKHVVKTCSGSQFAHNDPVAYARSAASAGAGEIMLQSIDRDGMENGFDLDLIDAVCKAVDVPVVALGGARNVEDLQAAVGRGAAAAAAGSMFVFFGPLRGVLINTPDPEEMRRSINIDKKPTKEQAAS